MSYWQEDVKPSLMVKASPVTGIQCVEFGGNEIQTWYSSPYPSEYQHLRRISICEFCFEYKKCSVSLQRHMVCYCFVVICDLEISRDGIR